LLLFETITFWIAVVAYAGSFGLFAFGMTMSKAVWVGRALRTMQFGFLLHTIALLIRWMYSGHPPFVSSFESMSAAAWFGVLGYLLLAEKKPEFTSTGVGLAAVVFLLLGWSSTPSISGEALSPSLQSVWLFIHATFATAGTGAFLFAAGISMIWIKQVRQGTDIKTEEMRYPSPEAFDEMAHRTIIIGFLFYTMMLISGAIWANQAWGRYWGWDPIESWSLFAWLIYAIYLHIHFTFKKLRGQFTAWYAIIAAAIAAFSLWGVGYVYATIHTYG